MVRTRLGLVLLVCSSTAFAQDEAPSHEVAFRNISFSFEHSLARNYKGDTIPAVSAAGGDSTVRFAAPEHVVITLRDSYVRNRDDESAIQSLPRLFFFPVASSGEEGFASSYPDVKTAVDDLRQLLGKRSGAGGVPFLPRVSSRMEFVARRKSMRFRNGRGIGFVTQFAGSSEPVTNDRLVYAFEGLTDDNKWYVSLVFPLEAFGLPGTAGESTIDRSFAAYLHETIDRIERLQQRSFSPPLNSIEDVVRTLKVGSP
jgi:hypothetical protein